MSPTVDDDATRRSSIGVVERFIAALNTGNLDDLNAVLSPTFVAEMPFAPPARASRIDGREALIQYVERLATGSGGMHLLDLEVDTLGSDPREVLATYRSDMTFPVTGRPYRNRYISRGRVEDGRLVYLAEYYNSAVMIEALGGEIHMPDASASGPESSS